MLPPGDLDHLSHAELKNLVVELSLLKNVFGPGRGWPLIAADDFSSAARQIGRQLRLERHAWKFWKLAQLSKAVANGTGCHADTDVSVQ